MHDSGVRIFADSLFDNLYQAERIDLSTLSVDESEEGGDVVEDVLTDEYFESIHRRPGRAERAIRNGDKGRAQHEKDQVQRLLEALQGYDWLKVLGVSGITESKKKDFEPARMYFIRGCQSVLEKFRIWKAEEKRQKLEKDLAAAEAEAEEEDDEDTGSGVATSGDWPDQSDDVDEAARQLHQEATARNPGVNRSRNPHRKSKLKTAQAAESQKQFQSFFQKPGDRETALRQRRRTGRHSLAWGHVVPEIPEAEFALPDGYLSKELMSSRMRAQRRDKRANKD